jgi:hypothetical protein
VVEGRTSAPDRERRPKSDGGDADGAGGDPAYAVARLTQAYFQGRPEAIFSTPAYLINLLIQQLPAIEAEQSLRQVSIVSTPHLKPRDRRSYVQRLARKAKSNAAREKPQRQYPDAVQDPAAAADWFASRGIKVVQAG